MTAVYFDLNTFLSFSFFFIFCSVITVSQHEYVCARVFYAKFYRTKKRDFTCIVMQHFHDWSYSTGESRLSG